MNPVRNSGKSNIEEMSRASNGMKFFNKNFFGYLIAFLAILVGSFAIVLGFGYVESEGLKGETSCTTSTGQEC